MACVVCILWPIDKKNYLLSSTDKTWQATDFWAADTPLGDSVRDVRDILKMYFAINTLKRGWYYQVARRMKAFIVYN